MPRPAACCTSTNKNQEPFPDDFQAKCKRPSWLRELCWAAGLTLHLHSKGGWDETSEGGKRKNCISVLPSFLCEQSRRSNFFWYCGTYKIWEVGGRSQRCNAEKTSYRRLVGVVGFIGSRYDKPVLATPGARSVFWDPLSFFFFLLLPLFLTLKNWFSLSSCFSACFQLKLLFSTLSCSRWQQWNWLSVH